jgi:hypothetical protein
MIAFSGTFSNGKPFTRVVETRYGAQEEIDDLFAASLLTREEWRRLTDWLGEPVLTDEPTNDSDTTTGDTTGGAPAADWHVTRNDPGTLGLGGPAPE